MFHFYLGYSLISFVLRCLLSAVCLSQSHFCRVAKMSLLGVLSTYIPDDLMLNGVVLVDLDNNVIQECGETTIHALPEKSESKLLKTLKKHV